MIKIQIDAKKESISIIFNYNKEIVDIIKTIPKRKYHGDSKLWTIPYQENFKDLLKDKFGSKFELSFPTESKNIRALEDMKNELIFKKYSRNTVKNYLKYFKDFCVYYKDRDILNIKDEEVHSY